MTTFLSADIENVPETDDVSFVFGSITEDSVLEGLPWDLDYIFHLATYHGNHSSIHDAIADHENNAYTSLKLFDCIRGFPNLKKVVFASAGCTVAKKAFDAVEATNEAASFSLYLDSPYQMSQIIGKFCGNYYFMRYEMPFVKTRFQNVYGPREILGARQWCGTPATVWGATSSRPSFTRRYAGSPCRWKTGTLRPRKAKATDDPRS